MMTDRGNRQASLAILVLVASQVTACTTGDPVGVAPGVSVARTRALSPGMTHTALLELLGQPLSVRPWGEGSSLLFYAREVPLAHHSPTLWVLVRDGVLVEAQAEWSDLWRLDEQGLFVVREGLRWESPELSEAFPPS